MNIIADYPNSTPILNDMVELIEILPADQVACDTVAESKKRALEFISHLITGHLQHVDPADVLEGLIARERLGSTAIGYGVAIPHCRWPQLQRPTAAMIRLAHPIDFNALDNQPVDILIALLVPENSVETHLTLLANIAELFSQPKLLEKLRQASDPDSLYAYLIQHHV